MGLLPCPIPCSTEKESESPTHPNPLLLESSISSSSLSSQSSLPSIPSLLMPPSSHTSTIHHHCLTTLKGHSSSVFSLALAGNFLYSGSSNTEILSWSLPPLSNSGSTVATTNGAVKSLIIVGDKLFSAHQDCKIRVWKIDNQYYKTTNQNYNCIATLPTLTDRFFTLFSTKNYVQVRRHKKCTWVHHVDTVSGLAMSKDSSLLYSVSWDRTIKVWRISDFKCLESIDKAHDDAINAIVLSNDGFVYTGSADKKIRIWKKLHNNKKHSLIATLESHKSGINALAISTDGDVIYSGACDRSILVWEKGINGDMVVVGALRGHSKAILCLAVASDYLVCSGSADCTVRIWRRELEKKYCCLAVFEGHSKAVKCLSAAVFDDDDNEYDNNDRNGGSVSGTSYLVYSGSLDCDIRIWKIYLGSN